MLFLLYFNLLGMMHMGVVILRRHFKRFVSASGQLHWQYTAPESERSWAVVHDLVQSVLYELRVVARNGDGEDAPETSSPVRRIRLGSKKGRFSGTAWAGGGGGGTQHARVACPSVHSGWCDTVSEAAHSFTGQYLPIDVRLVLNTSHNALYAILRTPMSMI